MLSKTETIAIPKGEAAAVDDLPRRPDPKIVAATLQQVETQPARACREDALRGDAFALERVAEPLHRAGIDAELRCDLAHARDAQASLARP